MMNTANKILLIIGSSFMGIGLVVGLTLVFSIGGPFSLIPFLFFIIGIVMDGVVFKIISNKKKIINKGRKYAAKIYSYVENTSYTVNGSFTLNVKAHYFDENGSEKEAILPTAFSKGSAEYPIGMTIDIYEYQGKYNFDPKSVRNEILPREKELMDNKPIDPEKINMVAVTCPSCGASYSAASGYTSNCPYCGSYHNT